MGLFNKILNKKQDVQPLMQNNTKDPIENIDGISLLDRHEKGLLDDNSFLRSFGKVKVYYSTPFGDYKDGGSKLFVLPAHNKTAYLPVFTSSARAMEFYEKVGRIGFIIMENSFVSFLTSTKIMNEGNSPIKMGAVIDPGYYGVTIDADILDTVINIMK